MEFKARLPDHEVNVSKTHPLSEAAWSIGGVVFLCVVLFASVFLAIELIVPRISPASEQNFFGAFHNQLSKVADELDSPEALRLQELTESLVKHWPDCPYTFRVGIMDSEDPNAMALPGGIIVVTRALLDEAQSENEVAFVLAHELGHFRNRDHLRGLGRGVAFGVVGSLILGSSGSGLPSLVEQMSTLTERNFSRGQESEADSFALQLTHAQYGHLEGATDFFERMAAEELGKGGRLAIYLQTHPASMDRVDNLQAQADTEGWPTTGPVIPWQFAPAESDPQAESPVPDP